MDNNFLEHYGKKGMKWGSRKSGGGSSSSGVRGYNAKNLSTQDLTRVIKRMELEQKYSELNKKGSAAQKGGGAVKKFLVKNGDKVAGVAITGVATAAVAAFLKSPKAMKQLNRLTNIK